MKCIVAFLLLFRGLLSCAQQPEAPYEKDIRTFEAEDRSAPPPRDAILFTGSSSIRFWNDLRQTFPDKKIINRGFGGSQMTDVLRYTDRIIIRYRPRQVVLYVGDNDLAAGQSPQQVFDSLVTLFTRVRQALPGTAFAYIAIKPSPSRRHLMRAAEETNTRIRQYLSRQPNTQFIDIYNDNCPFCPASS